ncbi:centrosomeassociated protein [Plasmopara halstedii]|uniref:Centrosomeassociated protein n=1 Tax=Plasmopara halstedii TaxID=4781 RepID=A0A0P1A9G6_PLAHL|nr:centrosomeassociated protein [Plasmopara halstedii]CEG37373.1 centrosomeassociated protein [Plasmopara halstedii]|eukprot:XP_024573742.1 centrosomeassociated protein [Plasmopara halstedii]
MASPVVMEVAATSSKCTRADCTSLREELELLRSDLLELESENEHLCDQLTSVQSDANARELQMHQRLSEKDDEVVNLKDKVTGLMMQLQQQLEFRNEKETISPDTPFTKIVDDKSLGLQMQNEALETKLRELQSQLKEEATAGIKAQRLVTEGAEKSKDERDELYTTLKENEVLRNETAKLNEAMETITRQVKEYQMSYTAMQDQLEAYRDVMDEQTLEMTQLHTKVEELELEKASLEAQLIEMDEKESDVDALMSDIKAKYDMEKAVLQAELNEVKQKLKQQLLHTQQAQESNMLVDDKEENNHTGIRRRSSTHMEDLERQLKMLQELRTRDKSTILELNQRILQQQSDLESLAGHFTGDSVVDSADGVASHRHKAKLDSFEQQNTMLNKRLKEQQELIQNLELRQGFLEKQLVDTEEWKAKYEQKAGLEEVVKYQKILRMQLEQQQQINVKLRLDLNEQVEATSKMHIAFERLKAEVGKPFNFMYDDLTIADHLKGQLAINEAVVKQMEAQIEELEAERLRHLQKLRDQARLNGHKLYEQHGLTTEQWATIEGFIERVRQTPEAANEPFDCTLEHTGVRDRTQSLHYLETAVDKLERKFDAKCDENTMLLRDIERLHCELEDVQSRRLLLATWRLKSEPDDTKSELLHALNVAKVRSQRQEGVIYHLRAEIASLHKRKESKELRETNSLNYDENPTQKNLNEKHTSDSAVPVCAGTQTSPCADNIKTAVQIQFDEFDCDGGDESLPVLGDNEPDSLHEVKEYMDPAIDHLPIEQKLSDKSLISERKDDRTDDIAFIVARAIEAQFALIKAQTGTFLPSVAMGTASSDDVEATSASSKDLANKSDEAKIVNHESAKSPMVDQIAFESEDEMIQQLDVLRELNVCLDDLVTTEARNEELQKQLHQHEEVFQSLMDQHTVLYQHFFQLYAQYASAEIRLRHDLDQMAEEKKEYQIRCHRYEAELHLLQIQSQQNASTTSDALISGNVAQLRSEVIELTRRLATFEVNEARYKRKYHQLHAEWRSSTEHNELLQHEWSEMERTLKYRVLYLETWKHGADEMIERMEKTLDKSVLREFVDKQQQLMVNVLKKYNILSKFYAEMHAKYIEVYDLPAQLSQAQHKLRVLQSEYSTRHFDKDGICNPDILHDRITQLESELQDQVRRVHELEEAKCKELTCEELVQTSGTEENAVDKNELRNENTLLYERINEVEQLYESLALECAKYKGIASLAASQANALMTRAAQEQGNREQQEEQLRDLMAASEDHAIVGKLQHQLMQIKTTYQQFLLQYNNVTGTQQQTLLRNQQLELEVEKKAQELTAIREKSRVNAQSMENAIKIVKERDWIARNTKWEAFRKRLDALEEELQIEHERRKQLEKDLDEKQAQLPFPELRQNRGNQSEVSRLKSQIDALTTRERLLMGQLEAVTKATGSKDSHLLAELQKTKTLNEDLMRKVETIQARNSQLLKLNGDLEAEKLAIRSKYEDLEIELQCARTDLSGGQRRPLDNQRDVDQGSSLSPLMRRKVGLYEKDQMDLQQAAQATIASLKQLVEDKNMLINEYQRKLALVRASSAQDKAQDRFETTQLNKKLFEENQRMIGQLKEAMGTISSMERSGKSKQALQAAQERQDQILQEWKEAEVALEKSKQLIRELQMERKVLQNERDLAEARAGEALEEIVLLKEKGAECEKHQQKLEQQLSNVKGDMTKKEEKLKALREAIIRLKEEFLKAEDRHAIEIVKAQHAMNNDISARKRKEQDRHEEEEGVWREEKARLQSQVLMLQEKLRLLKKKYGLQVQRKKRTKAEEKEEKESTTEANVQELKGEVERLERLVKERAVNEARTVEDLERKNKVLQAQNLALREATTYAPPVSTEVVDANKRHEQLQNEKKLQRRVGALLQKLKEKQGDIMSKNSELERCLDRISKLETELQKQQAINEKERLANNASVPPIVALPIKQQMEDLERQNAFLQRELVLKRKEWEKMFTSQMEKYEVQLQRLRRRFVRHGITSSDGDIKDCKDNLTDSDFSSKLQSEEQRFFVEQDVREELLALGDELRTKEQDMVSKDTRLLELELEVENLRLEYKRLERKQQHSKGGGLPGSDGAPKPRRVTGGRGSPWVTQERLELEGVIETMKKVIERLRAENENLKKSSAKQAMISPERVESIRRKLKEQKDARERLEAQLEKLQINCGELKKDKLKLQQKLRAKTAFSSSSKNEISTLELQVKDKDRKLLASEQELTELRHQVLQLETHVNAMDDAHVRQKDVERIKELEAQVHELEDENTKLTNELSAFDEDFFEEIEDLKYKYTQAVRDKRQLEKRLAREHSSGSFASITARSE